MANRPIFSVKDGKPYYNEVNIDFKWIPGMSIVRKRMCVKELHSCFLKKNPNNKVLEVSSKSDSILGQSLSAFKMQNTTFYDAPYSLEVIFQSSKVFENGGPFLDLLNVPPSQAKRDERLRTSGNMVCFKLKEKEYKLNPRTSFYDWIYINTLLENKELAKRVLEYDAFTDIEFNPEKSFNCQARAVAIYVSLVKCGLLNKALTSIKDFIAIVYNNKSVLALENDYANRTLFSDNE